MGLIRIGYCYHILKTLRNGIGNAIHCTETCHRKFGPEILGPGGSRFLTNFGPPGPILPEIMVRVGNIGPLTGVYVYVPKFPAVSFTGNNGLPWKVSMQVYTCKYFEK